MLVGSDRVDGDCALVGINLLSQIEPLEAVSALASVDAAQPEVDRFGWIRVGGQRIAAHYRDIRSAPLQYVGVVLKFKVDASSKASDTKVPGVNPTRLEQDGQKLVQDLTAALAPQGNGLIKRLCNYSGMELIWTRVPRSMYFEAVYPFSCQNGPLRYHASPIGHFIVSALNLAERDYPIAALPLVAVIRNADRRPSIAAQKLEFSWAFNGLCNTATLHTSSGTAAPNKTTSFKKWGAWSSGEQRHLLKALRTVEMMPSILSIFCLVVTNTTDGPRCVEQHGVIRPGIGVYGRIEEYFRGMD